MNAGWIKGKLWDENYFRPEKLGSKRIIYRLPWRGMLLTLLFDRPSGTPPWERCADESYTASFFKRLKPLIESCGASWVYIIDPDDALSALLWVRPVLGDESDSDALFAFELQGADVGGAQRLCLVFNDHAGMIVFERHDSFEISYYGSSDRWKQVARNLGLPSGFNE